MQSSKKTSSNSPSKLSKYKSGSIDMKLFKFVMSLNKIKSYAKRMEEIEEIEEV